MYKRITMLLYCLSLSLALFSLSASYSKSLLWSGLISPLLEWLLDPLVLLSLTTEPFQCHIALRSCVYPGAAPLRVWAGITSGLSDPEHSCQDKQPCFEKSRGGDSVSWFFRCGHWISHLHALELEVNGLTALHGSLCCHSDTLNYCWLLRVRYLEFTI